MAKKQFKAESKRLLDLMINSIYTNKEIFLREIISNASDALDKLRYIALTDESARAAMADELFIEIKADKDARTVTVKDNGIGMSKEELETNLGTICKSGSLAFKDGIPESDEAATSIIGQFGVGFYSAFMVAQRVEVITKRYDSDTAFKWTSSGAEGYSITETEKTATGTDIIMYIKEDTEADKYSDYLESYRLQSLVRTYSDYIPYPIRMELEKYRTEGEGDSAQQVKYFETETLNSMTPIWKRSKSEITKEQTDKFYKDTFFDYNAPAATIQISTEGLISYKALLFVPSSVPYDYFTKDYKKGLKLYSNGVLIMDACEDLLPDHFRFVKGVIESDDLSLNISREMLQQDRQLKTIAANIEKKIKAELKKLLEKERETYEKFYTAFGIQLKYGITADYGVHKDTLKDLLMFWSMEQEKFITLSEYVSRMPEGQSKIYYACGETAQKIAALPQTELVKARGFDMLCLTDEVDEFVVQLLANFEEKEFCSINSENADLQGEDAAETAKKAAQDNKGLLDFLKGKIDGLSDVVISKKLKSHAVCLSSTGAVTIEMEKYFAEMPGDGPKPKADRVLELNAEHPSFEALTEAFKNDKEKAAVLGEILYNQALLIADLPLPDPTRYTELVCKLMK